MIINSIILYSYSQPPSADHLSSLRSFGSIIFPCSINCKAYSILSSILALPAGIGKSRIGFCLCFSNKCKSMSNLIFVLYVEQNKQDRVGRPSNELSSNGVTDVTHLKDKEGGLVLESGVTVAKLLDLLL